MIFKPQQRETYEWILGIRIKFGSVVEMAYFSDVNVSEVWCLVLLTRYRKCNLGFTLTWGHSNSDCNTPSREKQATWKRLPCESPIKISPASEISMPLGKEVIFSLPMRYLNEPS